MRQLSRLIARALSETGLEDEFASMVARFEGWTGPTRNHRRRVWQALAEHTDRKFDHEWTLIAVRLFAYHERGEFCDEIAGLMMRARWDGERLREEEPVREMRTVRPRGAERDVG